MKGSPKNVVDEGRERSTKFFIVAFGSLDINITFLILEARICLMAFIVIPALGGSINKIKGISRSSFCHCSDKNSPITAIISSCVDC